MDVLAELITADKPSFQFQLRGEIYVILKNMLGIIHGVRRQNIRSGYGSIACFGLSCKYSVDNDAKFNNNNNKRMWTKGSES